MIIKKQIVFIVPLIFFLILSGCTNRSTSASIKSQEPVILKMAWWGEQPRNDATEQVIHLFEKEHPDIKIEFEYLNWDDYWKKLDPLAAANQLPDIIQMDLLYLKPYSKSHLLEDLTPYIKNHTIDTKSVDGKVLSSGVVDDKLVGMPLGLNAPLVLLNKSMLSGEGLSCPKADWTWTDFENIVLDVHKSSQLYGTNGLESPEVFFQYYLQTKGESLYNSDGTSLGYDNDQLFIDYFNMQLHLLNQGAMPTAQVMQQINRIADEPLVNQQAAMTWTHSNQYYSFSQAAKEPFQILPPPGPGQNSGLVVKPGQFFSIAKGSKHKKEAAKFINFFINNIEANKLLKAERGVPVASNVANEVKKELPNDQKKIFDYVERVESNNPNIEKAYPIGAVQVVDNLEDISNQVLFKKITPEKGARLFRKEANLVLSKNKKG
ncbi:multiple sugar transport system substrate-binding protein [Pullulanibacillus pueri]|uniref:Putative ABC transporter substrate-binding protein YesO n=1 Tax=Pullulanibacillus pueri TaxID=1437324 RepID=A0A8J2ZYP2_9BACL|nr:ABC transporter substrate-binding protein [Pullulanibacillus pueri]MBM7683517.1 multiple sugar transport system substrate-binding protein [Pullulanibacillus pueri]GGH86940.1 putative ABC transporter substrate-binding protein YesO [Pullulanibacillus pueri]